MPYREEAEPLEPPGQPGARQARLLADAGALKRFSRRGFLSGTGASAVLAADMLFTRRVQTERRVNRILQVPDDFADALALAPAAATQFAAMNSGDRYPILHTIVTAPNPATRANRIARQVALLATAQTPR